MIRNESDARCGIPALIFAIMGGVWFFWAAALGASLATMAAIGIALAGIALVGAAIYAIRTAVAAGVSMRDEAARRPFLIVLVLETVAILIGINVAINLGRPELAPLWTSFVVGLHFIPLARIFRRKADVWVAFAVILWCIICVAAFRGNILAWNACFGTGTLLWIASAYYTRLGLSAMADIIRVEPRSDEGRSVL